MVIAAFPPIDSADENGILAVGGDLEVESLLLAYSSGIFPWPFNDEELVWFAPPKRAILGFDDFHISRSLARKIKQKKYQAKKNTGFRSVITACAQTPRGEESDTWITAEMIEAYCQLHQAGFAKSYEIYVDDALVGGIYGVQIGKYFAAESMFHTVSDASKLALYELIQDLKVQGVTWIDVQVQNSFLKTLGIKEITREEFNQRLKILVSS